MWDGTNWSVLGKGLYSAIAVLKMIADDDGNIYLGGYIIGAYAPKGDVIVSTGLLKWNGNVWISMQTTTAKDPYWDIITSMVIAPYLNVVSE